LPKHYYSMGCRGNVTVFDHQEKDWHEKNSSEFFESLFERADAIEREVVATRRCEVLTQAMLGKEFRGEFVTAGMADITAI